MTSFAVTRDCLLHEIHLLGGTLPVLSTNMPLRLGRVCPTLNFRQPEDKGVAVYFTLKGQQMCFACDRWDSVADNVHAIRKTIEALRGIERWGTGDMVQQAFTGFIALPSNSPWAVLGLKPDANPDEIKAAYREKARTATPDQGGQQTSRWRS